MISSNDYIYDLLGNRLQRQDTSRTWRGKRELKFYGASLPFFY
jgi:hypothetical protein